MYEKVSSYIDEYGMLEGMECVAVGLSGGADSVCLLLMLKKYADMHGAPRIVAVHVQHGIRGDEALADAAFCEELCAGLGVELVRFDYNVPELARKERISEEEMGRRLRYESFRKALSDSGCKKGVIAVAHHKNDQAETVLWNIVRGSSLRGAGGMRPVAGDVIRPLLSVSRADIEKWLNERGESYRNDSTNYSTDYTRNKLRLEVIPYLEDNINHGAGENLCRFAKNAGQAADFISGEIAVRKHDYVSERKDGWFISDDLIKEHPVILKGVIYDAVSSLSGMRDLEEKHIMLAAGLFSLQCGRSIDLPMGVTAKRTYGGILILKKCESAGNKDGITMDIISADGLFDKKILRDHYTKYFDYDKIIRYTAAEGIEPMPQVRHRQAGDYIVINSDGSRKKLKELFIDSKVPVDDRDDILLCALGSNVLWAVNVRGSEAFRVDEDTERVLRIALAQ